MSIGNHASVPAAEPGSTIISPSRGLLTQGTIFSGATASTYYGCDVHGLVITARCDISNDKIHSYNYLPVVAFSDWIHRDGRIILAERLRAESLGSLRTVLRDCGHSPTVLETESLDRIDQLLFDLEKPDRNLAKSRKRFAEKASDYELATRALTSSPDERLCNLIVSRSPYLKEELMKELTGYRLSGFHFLRQIEPRGTDLGFVALLREIQMLPRAVGVEIASGFGHSEFEEMCKTDGSLRGRMNVPEEKFAMPVGVLASPYIEHLMQAFATLFGRIGITDHEPSYIRGLWERQPGVKEGI
jgi:hypothetical protein